MKYYSKEHFWIRLDSDETTAVIGLTEYAVRKFEDISYFELPQEGTDLIVGDELGVLETLNKSTNVYSPISGTVVSVNRNLEDDPGILVEHPDDKGWICKMENIDLAEFDDLMEEEAYRKFLKTL